MKRILKIISRVLIIFVLTILTQVGGFVYLISVLIRIKKNNNYRLKRLILFIGLYLFTTILILPYLAPIFGREKIKNNDYIKAHTLFTILCNRNYVNPELHLAIQNIGKTMNQKHNGIKVIYLDANFPFINGFPLLPHLSHNDGKKVDLSFVYSNQDKITNKKPSILGYGVFENPAKEEQNQTTFCKKKGYWQYDLTKYTTLGLTNNQLKLSEKATKDLLLTIVDQQEIKKIFIEPHLKNRLHLQSNKIRFHGCQAVRHDDHIHIQL